MYNFLKIYMSIYYKYEKRNYSFSYVVFYRECVFMNLEEKIEKAKVWNLRSNVVMGIGMSLTWPVIQVWMIQHISGDFYKIVVFIQELLALLFFVLLDKKDEKGLPINLIKARRYFIPFVVIDILLLLFSNFMYFIPEVRFILVTIANGSSSVIWVLVMQDIFNQVISGTNLTVFTNKLEKVHKFGSIAGITILLFLDLSLEAALVIQSFAFVYMAYYDVKIYKLLLPELPEYRK